MHVSLFKVFLVDDSNTFKEVYVIADDVKQAWDKVNEAYPINYRFHSLEIIANAGNTVEHLAHVIL